MFGGCRQAAAPHGPALRLPLNVEPCWKACQKEDPERQKPRTGVPPRSCRRGPRQLPGCHRRCGTGWFQNQFLKQGHAALGLLCHCRACFNAHRLCWAGGERHSRAPACLSHWGNDLQGTMPGAHVEITRKLLDCGGGESSSMGSAVLDGRPGPPPQPPWFQNQGHGGDTLRQLWKQHAWNMRALGSHALQRLAGGPAQVSNIPHSLPRPGWGPNNSKAPADTPWPARSACGRTDAVQKADAGTSRLAGIHSSNLIIFLLSASERGVCLRPGGPPAAPECQDGAGALVGCGRAAGIAPLHSISTVQLWRVCR